MRRQSESAQAPSYLHLQMSVRAFGQQEWTYHATGHADLVYKVNEAFFYMQILIHLESFMRFDCQFWDQGYDKSYHNIHVLFT